jgi:hypothetical protein
MPPKRKGAKPKAKSKAKAATLEPAQEAPLQAIDTVDEREAAKQTLMEIDSTPVEEVEAEEPVAPTPSEAKSGMTPQERAQKLAALRAKMVVHYQLFLCTDCVGC